MGSYEDLLRLTLATFNERGVSMYEDPEVLELMRGFVHPEIECRSAGGVQGGSYRGIDGLIEMVGGFSSAFAELTTDLEEVLDETERSFVATVRYRGLGAASGAPIDEVYVWAQRFEDGLTVAFAIDRDREGAERLAGL